MKLGISVSQIMQQDFPVIDIEMPIESCLKIMNKKYEGCLILKHGSLYGILGYDELLEGFLKRKKYQDKIEKLNIKTDFETISPQVDVGDVIEKMSHKNIDFIVVRNKNNILGLITKKEIIEIEPILLEMIHAS